MNCMNTTAIWQKIERLLEKTEHSDYVAIFRDDFEEAMKDASDFAYVEIENVAFPDLLEKLRKELAALPMHSARNGVMRIGTTSDGAEGKLLYDNVCSLLKTIQEFTSGANLIWGLDVDPAISSGCYSVAVVFAKSSR